jgi:hypothetical protein
VHHPTTVASIAPSDVVVSNDVVAAPSEVAATVAKDIESVAETPNEGELCMCGQKYADLVELQTHQLTDCKRRSDVIDTIDTLDRARSAFISGTETQSSTSGLSLELWCLLVHAYAIIHH